MAPPQEARGEWRTLPSGLRATPADQIRRCAFRRQSMDVAPGRRKSVDGGNANSPAAPARRKSVEGSPRQSFDFKKAPENRQSPQSPMALSSPMGAVKPRMSYDLGSPSASMMGGQSSMMAAMMRTSLDVHGRSPLGMPGGGSFVSPGEWDRSD